MKRSLGLLALCLAVSACGSSDRVAARVPPSPTALRFSAASNSAFARLDARRLLGMVVLPRSARRVPGVPKSAPSWLRARDALERRFNDPNTERAHRTWIVQAPLNDVVAYFQAHTRPRGGVPGAGTWRGSSPNWDWQFNPVPWRVSDRRLNVDMAALPSGTTVVTAGSWAAIIRYAPSGTEIRGSVTRIDITTRYYDQPPVVRLHVRDPYLVGTLVSWMNGLGLAGTPMCLGGYSGLPSTTLTFRDAHGAVIARGVYPQVWPGGRVNQCRPFSLAVNGHQPVTLDAAAVLLRMQKRLNADFSPPVPVVVARCLRERGWNVRKTADGLAARKTGPPTTLTFLSTGKVTSKGPQRRAIGHCLQSRPFVVYLG